ncbi:phosphatase PAP2 family protein, partial [bacterium]|nr:phosphatase PAP2 family protein [bacterium]
MNLFFIFSAKYLFLLVILIAGVYFLRQPRDVQKKIVIFSLISLPVIYLLAILAGHIYYDPRPFVVGNFTPLIPHAADNGFPSDHALLVSAVAAIIVYFHRRVGAVLWVLALIVSLARVYVGVHHLVDIIGSLIISL